MHARFVPTVLGALLAPLSAERPRSPAGALHSAIGPESALGAAARRGAPRGPRRRRKAFTRLYPRDFWYVGEIAK